MSELAKRTVSKPPNIGPRLRPEGEERRTEKRREKEKREEEKREKKREKKRKEKKISRVYEPMIISVVVVIAVLVINPTRRDNTLNAQRNFSAVDCSKDPFLKESIALDLMAVGGVLAIQTWG